MKSMCKGALGALIVVLALSGLTAASALAAGAPVVETKPATSVAGAEATLNGNVEANGATTEYYFEYGTTTSYGSKTEVTGISKLGDHKTITGLEVKTGYHFRIVATNSYGTSYGADQAFTTASTSLPEFKDGPGESGLNKFTGAIGEGSWHLAGGGIFPCSGGPVSGTISGAKTMTGVTILFTDCRDNQNRCPTGEGEHEGEVKTEPLEGTLVYISKTAKTVGIDLKPQTGKALARYHCQGANAEIQGSVVLPIANVNERGSHFTLHANAHDEYEKESGEKKIAQLETNWPSSSSFEPMYWEFAGSFTTSKDVEIKA